MSQSGWDQYKQWLLPRSEELNQLVQFSIAKVIKVRFSTNLGTMRVSMEEFVKPSAGSVGKSVGSDVYIEAKRWFGRLDSKGEKLKKYRDGIRHSLGHIQIMGMASSKPLDRIYVGIRAIESLKKHTAFDESVPSHGAETNTTNNQIILQHRTESEVNQIVTELGYVEIADLVETMVETSRDRSSSAGKDSDDHDIKQQSFHGVDAIGFVSKYDKLVVLGQPGCGKTTLLKYLALAYSGWAPTKAKLDPLLPIFVPLREMGRIEEVKPTAEWLTKFVLSCADDICEERFNIAWIKGQLSKGNCIILLDGLDEIPPEDIGTVVQSINAFSTKFRSNKIVTTCRVAAYNRLLEGFNHCQIDEFNASDRKSFIDQWFGDKMDDAKRLLFDLERSNSASELCKTPILMTLICVQYQMRRSIPENRAELYEACVDALMFQWDTFRSIERPTITGGLSPNRKKMILSKIAKRTFDDQQYYFRKKHLLNMLSIELQSIGLDEVGDEELLEELESHNGLLVERSIGIYCFSHLTFHEFFAALAYHESGNLVQLFHSATVDRRYREVFLMVLERLYSPDSILLSLCSRAKTEFIDKQRFDENLKYLMDMVLEAQIPMTQKIRALIVKVRSDLAKMPKADQSHADTVSAFDEVDLELIFGDSKSALSEDEEFELLDPEDW